MYSFVVLTSIFISVTASCPDYSSCVNHVGMPGKCAIRCDGHPSFYIYIYSNNAIKIICREACQGNDFSYLRKYSQFDFERVEFYFCPIPSMPVQDMFVKTNSVKGISWFGNSQRSSIFPNYNFLFYDVNEVENVSLRNTHFSALPFGLFVKLSILVTLNISTNALKELPNLETLKDLEYLNIAKNQLTNIPPNQFINLTRLTYLDISYNKLTSFTSNQFANLYNLESLEIRHNNLTELPQNLLNNLTALVVFNVASNKLTYLPPKIFQDTVNLMTLDLSHNMFSTLASELRPYQMTTFYKNKIENKSIPENREDVFVLGKYICADEMRMYSSEFRYIGDGFLQNCSRVKKIDLHNNSIENISMVVFQNKPELSVLDLSYNHLTYLPIQNFSGTPILKVLNLANNGLIKLEIYLFQNMTELSRLNLSKNQFKNFSESLFCSMNHTFKSKLEYLNVSKNQLKDIPRLLFQCLGNLQNLDISYNTITYLPSGFFENLINIRFVNMSWNSLISFTTPLSIDLPIQVLDLSHNHLSGTCMICNMRLIDMLVLRLNNNNFTGVFGVSYLFEQQMNLKEIYIDNNFITNIFLNGFLQNFNLEILSASNNSIASITGLSYLKEVRKIDLKMNKITSLSKEYILLNSYNVEVDLRFNLIDSFDFREVDIKPSFVPYLTSSCRVIIENNPVFCGVDTILQADYFKDSVKLIGKNSMDQITDTALILNNLTCLYPVFLNDVPVKDLGEYKPIQILALLGLETILETGKRDCNWNEMCVDSTCLGYEECQLPNTHRDNY